VIEAKIVLAGDMAVGKSSLAGRYNKNQFNDIYQNTIGGVYFQKIMNVPDPENEGQM
jgi:GTPase SAR1 family protein